MSYQPGTVQVGGCVPHNLSAAQIAASFDATGLGLLQYLGWAICNGSNGTPDLTDLFVKHSNAAAGTTGGSGTTSGSSTPSSGSTGPLTAASSAVTVTVSAGVGATPSGSSHTHSISPHLHTIAHTHDTEPPYMTLVYLMRIY